MSLKSLGDMLKKSSQTRPVLSAAHICAFVTAMGSGRYRARSFRQGLLVLEVDSSALAQTISLELPEIEAEVDSHFKAKVVKRIRVYARPRNQNGDDR